MSNFIYLDSKTIYGKLKGLLEQGVQFSRNIKDKYFCIFNKSQVLAFKVGKQWYVNLNNWGIDNEQVLYDLNINAVTPGSYALREVKKSIPNYNTVWPKLNDNLNKAIKSGYNSGLLYSKPGLYNHKMYHYDVNGAYGYAFKEAYLPVGLPRVIPGYVPPDGKHLHIYFMDLSVEYENPNIFPYLVNSNDLYHLPSEIIDNTGLGSLYKVVTETEYGDLIKDYDVISETYYTLQFEKTKGLFNGFVDKYNKLKNESVGDYRTIYKTIIASLAGKLSQELTETQVPIRVNEFGVIEYEVVRMDAEYLNPAVSLFVVDYVRKLIRDVIKTCYKDVVLVDTDGFITTRKLDLPLGSELGQWKETIYDRVMVNGKRSYFFEKNGTLYSSISGFGDINEEKINSLTFDELIHFRKLHKPLSLYKKILYCGEEKWVKLNIHLNS